MRISDWSSDVCSSDLPQAVKKLVQSFGVTASIASRMAFQRSGRVLAAAFLRAALILAKASSIGLKSGLYGGRRRSSAPAASMTFLTARGLWAGRLSKIGRAHV